MLNCSVPNCPDAKLSGCQIVRFLTLGAKLSSAKLSYNPGKYLVILGQKRLVLVASVIHFEKIYGLHILNHQIIEYWVS